MYEEEREGGNMMKYLSAALTQLRAHFIPQIVTIVCFTSIALTALTFLHIPIMFPMATKHHRSL